MIKTSIDDPDALNNYLDNVQDQMRDAIREIRRISHQLAPSIDSSLPFVEKIKDLTSSMNISNDLDLSFDFDAFEKPVNHDIQLALYRIVQEQMTNIIKYSKASSVGISVQQNEGELTMWIKDNGIGFDPMMKKDGIGLVNMKRRMTALNGKVKILSTPGKGCNLMVEVPV
jgi:signal transduction histidine kinase